MCLGYLQILLLQKLQLQQRQVSIVPAWFRTSSTGRTAWFFSILNLTWVFILEMEDANFIPSQRQQNQKPRKQQVSVKRWKNRNKKAYHFDRLYIIIEGFNSINTMRDYRRFGVFISTLCSYAAIQIRK